MKNKRSLFTLLLPKIDKDIEQYSLFAQSNVKSAKELFDFQEYKFKIQIDDKSKEIQSPSELIVKKQMNYSYSFNKSIKKAEDFILNGSRNNNDLKSTRPTSCLVNTIHNKKMKIKHNKHSSSLLLLNRSNMTGFLANDNKSPKLIDINSNKSINRYDKSLIGVICKKRPTPSIILTNRKTTPSILNTYNKIINKFQRNNLPKNKSYYKVIKKKIDINQYQIDKEQKSNTFCEELLKSIDHSCSFSSIRARHEELIQTIKHDNYENDKAKDKLFNNYSAIYDYFNYDNDRQNDIEDLKKEYQTNLKQDTFSKMMNHIRLKDKLNIIGKINSDIAYSQRIYISNKLGVEMDKEFIPNSNKKVIRKTNRININKSKKKIKKDD